MHPQNPKNNACGSVRLDVPRLRCRPACIGQQAKAEYRKVPKKLTGLKSISPVGAAEADAVRDDPFANHTETAISRQEKAPPVAMPLASIVEHFLDPAGSGVSSTVSPNRA